MSRAAHAPLCHAIAYLLYGIATVLSPTLVTAPAIAQAPTQPSATPEAETFEKPASAAKRLRPAVPPYPAALRTSIDASRRYCLAEGGMSFVFSPGLVRTGDLNGDGRPDYVIDLRESSCSGRPSMFNGTAGWDVEIYVARSRGLVRVFAGLVLDYDVDNHHRGSMLFRLHGGHCGKFGPDLCIKRRRLDGHPFQLRDR